MKASATDKMSKIGFSSFAVAEASQNAYHDAIRPQSSAQAALPEKFRGTKADQHDMVILGKKQVLRRNFRFTTILGFASTGE